MRILQKQFMYSLTNTPVSRSFSKGWADKTNGEKVWAYNYYIHLGAIWGLTGKILAFFLSLIAASLPVTGFIIWYGCEKKQRKRRSEEWRNISKMKIPKPVIPGVSRIVQKTLEEQSLN